jgi:hypothetical protein
MERPNTIRQALIGQALVQLEAHQSPAKIQ